MEATASIEPPGVEVPHNNKVIFDIRLVRYESLRDDILTIVKRV